MLNKKPWILASVVIFIGVAAALLNRQPANSGNVTGIELPANSSEEYDAFSDPNVLWGSEEAFHWELEYPSGSIVISSGLTDLMSSANEMSMVAFVVDLIYMCEFHPIDINNLLIPNSLMEDNYLIECIQMFNKADDLNGCTEFYIEARSYVEDTVSTEEFLKYFYSWRYNDAKWVRSRFVEWGFTPVYNEKLILNEADKLLLFGGPQEEFIRNEEKLIEKLLTFVGSPKNIQHLEGEITKNEIYLLRLLRTTSKES